MKNYFRFHGNLLDEKIINTLTSIIVKVSLCLLYLSTDKRSIVARLLGQLLVFVGYNCRYLFPNH